MMGLLGSLLEWVENFIRHRDISRREIVSLDREKCGDSFSVVFVNKSSGDRDVVFVCPELDFSAVRGFLESELSKDSDIAGFLIVMLNNESNLKEVVRFWDSLVGFSSLFLVFVDLKGNEHVSVCPRVHDFVSDRSKLELGLKSILGL